MASTTDETTYPRDHRTPYSNSHPIPTIQKYREHKAEHKENHKSVEQAQKTEEDESRPKRAFNSVKHIVKDEDKKNPDGDPYPTANRLEVGSDKPPEQSDGVPLVPGANDSWGEAKKRVGEGNGEKGDDGTDQSDKNENTDGFKKSSKPSATEKASGHTDPKQKRKEMKHNKREDGGREVTDPVTHLPLIIRDSTAKDLARAPENEPKFGAPQKTSTGLSEASKSSSKLDSEEDELQEDYNSMQRVFPPPSYDNARAKMAKTYQLAFAMGVGMILLLSTSVLLVGLFLTSKSSGSSNSNHKISSSWGIFWPLSVGILITGVGGAATIFGLQGWLGKKVEGIWKDEVWDSARADEMSNNEKSETLPESVAWMNSLLASVWPLINPDLFASIVDMLEDVMQASLPKIVRMVSIDDIGQGSESIRVLGIRWLPTGAASQSVDEDGTLKGPDNSESNDRKSPGEGEEDRSSDDNHQDEEENGQSKQELESEQAMKEGLEAEQGDFVNMELAFVYRARSSGKTIKSKVKNAHLYLKFYLPGGIFVPVWVELRGIIGTMRLRLQLTPDPPFFSLCTLTFLGQPQVDLSCVPLSKRLPNLMNVPLISSFVQSSIDAALAEYVAPRSLTLDLKDMLVGDDFKKDTSTRGVIMILIKEAKDFKEGDGGIGPFKGSSDSYVTCSWGKFGKTIASTRVIKDDQSPKWHEWAQMLVSPQEIDADEKLRVQLWDSDRLTADDDLGRVEIDLKELMHGAKTKNQMLDREDRWKSSDPDSNMPGVLVWSVGYYSKIPITKSQLKDQTIDKSITSTEELKEHVSQAAERKLREATAKDIENELDQQTAQDYKEMEDAMICSAPPDADHPSGILSIQIHNITGLQVESLQKQDKDDKDDSVDREEEDEQSDDLPSSYCTIILNHKKVYMTRTKPKNSKPFFNAGTERFVRDWRTAEVMISVRDSREKEKDALLGILYLPLTKVLKDRSQIMQVYPLIGGVGFGRARVSLVFRSVELKMPKEMLGWDYGTLEVKSPVKAINLPEDLQTHRIKLRSKLSKIKMQPENDEWHFKGEKKSDFLACHKRYSSALVIEFRKSKLGPDSTPAFAVFWQSEIPDEEERTVKIKVWKGGKENLKKATTCVGYNGLDEGEDSLGEIEITLKFWRGLSGYHKGYARKDKNTNMQGVIEVLDTVNDEMGDDGDISGPDSDSDSDSDSSDSDSDPDTSKKPRARTNQSAPSDSSKPTPSNIVTKIKSKADDMLGDNDSEDGERGVKGQVRDYKENYKGLHRRHRGIMQWKAMRSADWGIGKVRRGIGKVGRVGNHGDKGGQGVETEV